MASAVAGPPASDEKLVLDYVMNLGHFDEIRKKARGRKDVAYGRWEEKGALPRP